jgi:uncharacterized delta-60 repeat protein
MARRLSRWLFPFAALSVAAACTGFDGAEGGTTPPAPTARPDGGPGPVPGEAERGLEVTVGAPKATAFVMQGRALALPVKLTRRGITTGAVTVTVTKLPKGLTADPLVIPAAAVEGTLTLHAATAPATDQGPSVLDVAAVEAGAQGAGASTKLSAFVRGTPGALDTTFGDAGAVLHAYGSDAKAVDAKVTSGGSILIGLRRVTNVALSRFTGAGLIDTTFAGGGTTNIGSSQSSMLIDLYEPPAPAKGFIYALETGAGVPTLFRTHLDGSLDTHFNGSGKVTVDDGLGLSGASQGSAVIALPDGKALVLAGHQADPGTVVTRWNSNGSLDDTYGNAGTCQLSGTGIRMFLRPGGAVFVFLRTGPSGGVMKGCTASGAPDTTIGSSPEYSYAFDASAVDVARTPDGGFAFLENTVVGAGAPYAAWSRVNASFVRDTSIGSFGSLQTPLSEATGFLVQADGGALVAGALGPDFKVLRYTSKGLLDPDFGVAGTATLSIGGFMATLSKLVAQPDGRVLAIGKHDNGTFDAALVRFWP